MQHFPIELNEEETKAYEMLLVFTQMSVGELSHYGNIDFENAQTLIKSLEEKGLLSPVTNFGNRVLAKFPFLQTHTHFKELCDNIRKTDAESKQFFTERKNDLDSFQASKNEEIKTIVQERVDTFNEHSSELKNNIDTTITEFDAELKAIEEKFIADINENHESNIQAEKKKITAKEQAYHGKIDGSQEKILTSVDEHKKEFDSITDEFIGTINEHSAGFLNGVKDKFVELLQSFRDDLTKYETDYHSSGKEWTNESLTVQKDAYQSFSTALDEIISTIATQLEEQEKAINNFSIEGTTSAEEPSEVTAYLNSVSAAFVKYKDDLTAGLTSSQKKYKEDRDTTNANVETFKAETTQKINNFTSSYLDDLNSNYSDFKTQTAETVEKSKVDVNGFYNLLQTDFTELEKDRTSGLASIKTDMENQQKIALELQKTTLHDLDNAILLPFTTQFEEINRNKKNFFKELTKNTDTHYKALDLKLKELINNLKGKYDEFTQVTQTKSDTTMQKANQEFEKFVKDEQKILTKHLEDLKKPVPKVREDIEKQKNELDATFTSTLGNLDQTVLSQVENLKNSLETIKAQFVSSLSADLTAIVNSTDDEDQTVTKLELVKKIKDNIAKKQQTVERDLSKIGNSIQSKLLDGFKKDLTDLTSSKDKLLLTMTNASESYFNGITSHLDGLDTNLIKKTEDLNKKVTKNIEAAFTKLKGDYKKFIKEQYKTTEEHIKEIQKSVLPANKKAAINQIRAVNKIYTPELKRLKQVVTAFSTSSHELLSKLDSVIITGIPDNLNANIERTSAEIVNNSKKAQESLSTFKTDWLASLELLHSTLDNFNEANKTKHETKIENIKSESLAVLEQTQNACLSFNSEIHDHASKHVQDDHDQFQSLLENSLGEVKTGLLNVVQEQQKLNKDIENQKLESFTSQEQQIQERYAGISKQLESIVTTFRETTQNKVNEREGEVNRIHQEYTATLITDCDQFNSKFKGQTADIMSSHKTDYKAHHSTLKTIASQFLAEIETDVNNFSDAVRNDATERMKGNGSLLKEKTNLILKVHDQFEASVQKTITTANGARDDLIVTADAHYDKLTYGNGQFSAELQTTVTKGLTILEPKITILEEFEQLVNNYKFPKITSLPVIGQGGAMDTIANFLKDFKASVTLLIPNPSDIPAELIYQTKRPKRVTIASMFDPNDPGQKELIRNLVEQDNVTVRQLSRQANLPLYLSADRDSEETFFGAQDPENKAEFAGMVSQSSPYIEFIGKTITSDFLSRAKKLS